MKYTKEERNAIYKKALEIHLQIAPSFGLCYSISHATFYLRPRVKTVNHYEMMFELCIFDVEQTKFPELVKYRPENSCKSLGGIPQVDFWFPQDTVGFNKRIEILKKVIEETNERQNNG